MQCYQNNVERFLGVKGRKCRNYESNYHSSKGELLALLYGITKFEPLLRLNQFIVMTYSTTALHWSTMKDLDMDDPLLKVTKTCSPCPGKI